MDRATRPCMVVFQDGLGERRTGRDSSGAELEILCLRKDLADAPSFEFALRERVDHLASFKHASYSRIRGVERTVDPSQALTVTSERTPGLRLSEFLARASARGLAVDVGSALFMIRQLVSSLALLHETVRDAAHGAVAPERLILTPEGRLVVHDYALGSALEQLLYSRDRYWVDLRVALPRVAGLPRFDQLADVTQAGVVAMALILGRSLEDGEYPGKLADVLGAARAVSPTGESEPLSPGLKQWLERASQLDQRQSFPSAIEARLALDGVLEEGGYDASPGRLQGMLARCLDTAAVGARVGILGLVPARPVVANEPHQSSLVQPSVQAPTSGHEVGRSASPSRDVSLPIPPEPLVAQPLPSRGAAELSGAQETEPEPEGSTAEFPVDGHGRRWRPWLVAAAAVVVVLLGSGATLASRRFLADPAPAGRTGVLALNTDPTGALVSVDGVAHGETPVKLTLSAGAHAIALRGLHGTRTVSVTIAEGEQVAHFIDLPKPVAVAPASVAAVSEPSPAPASVESTAPLGGWVSVAGLFDVELYENGKLLGTSETDRIMVPAGRHEFELVNEALGYRAKRSVQVAPGQTAQITFDSPSGTMALNAFPWAEVWLDGAKIGETPIGNVTVPIGDHDVMFRHPDLGDQEYRVTVTLASPARLSVDLRKK